MVCNQIQIRAHWLGLGQIFLLFKPCVIITLSNGILLFYFYYYYYGVFTIMKKWGSEEIISCCLEYKVETILWLSRRYESNKQKRKQRRWEYTREQRSSFGVWVCIDNQEYKETYRGSKKAKEWTSKRKATLYIY